MNVVPEVDKLLTSESHKGFGNVVAIVRRLLTLRVAGIRSHEVPPVANHAKMYMHFRLLDTFRQHFVFKFGIVGLHSALESVQPSVKVKHAKA